MENKSLLVLQSKDDNDRCVQSPSYSSIHLRNPRMKNPTSPRTKKRLVVSFLVGMATAGVLLLVMQVVTERDPWKDQSLSNDASIRPVDGTDTVPIPDIAPVPIPLFPEATPAPITFAELAKKLLPIRYDKALPTVENAITPQVQPGDLTDVRKMVLQMRDLVDVFAPVYPLINVKSDSNDIDAGPETTVTRVAKVRRRGYQTEDVLSELRFTLMVGYETIGEYVDLNHSQVIYSPELEEEKRLAVLIWKSQFNNFVQTHDVRSFLSAPLTRGKIEHQNESHYFWKNVPFEMQPKAQELATKALQILGHAQLQYCLQCWIGQDVTPTQTHSTTPTRLSTRKDKHLGDADAINTAPDPVNTVPDALPDLPANKTSHAHPVLTPVRNLTDILDAQNHDTYHNLRKAIRAVMDEYILVGPYMFRNGDQQDRQARDALVKVLQDTRVWLGQINDMYTAYTIYREENIFPEKQQQLHDQMIDQWNLFLQWASSSVVSNASSIFALPTATKAHQTDRDQNIDRDGLLASTLRRLQKYLV